MKKLTILIVAFIFTTLQTFNSFAQTIKLANNGTQVTTTNVLQGTANHILHKFTLAVASANATFTGLKCVTAGTYASADILNLKVRYSTDATLSTDDATLSTLTNPRSAGIKTFLAFSKIIISGTTGYIFITADIFASATAGKTINVNAIATTDLTFSSGTKTGSTTAGGAQTFTVPIPSIAIADNGSQVANADVLQGTANHILHKFALAITTANATLTGLKCVTAGTYASADILNLKVRYSTDATLDGADAILSTFVTPGTAGIKTFPAFSKIINSGTTGYIFITADIAASATAGKTINVNAVTTAQITFSSGTETGSTTAGGIQTFAIPSILIADNVPQITKADILQGQVATNLVLHKFSLQVTIANATFTGMQCVTAGTFVAGDIVNLKVRYSTDATLSADDATLSTFMTPASGTTAKTFPSFSKVINSGTTGYIFITADISASATAGKTISVNAIATTDLFFLSGTKTGTTSAGGLQTIVAPYNAIFNNIQVLQKAKIGTGTLILENYAGGLTNSIYTDNTGIQKDLFIQSNPSFSNNTIINANGGYVGIGTGTATPQQKLHVSVKSVPDMNGHPAGMRIEHGYITNPPTTGKYWDMLVDGDNGNLLISNTSNANGFPIPAVTVRENGNVGIGITTPQQQLHVFGNVLLSGEASSLLFGNGEGYTWGNWGIEYHDGGLNFWKPYGSVGGFENHILFLKNDGKVGIGTENPTAKLSIQTDNDNTAFSVYNSTDSTDNFKIKGNGFVWARDVTVTIEKPFPDFVFDNDYNLKSITEVENYIKTNRHLPNVPSQNDVKQNGLKLGDMNVILLQKLEEQMLYIIELKKMIDKQQVEIESLKNK